MKVKAFQPLPPNVVLAQDAEITLAPGAPVKNRHDEVIGVVISATPVEGGLEVVMDIDGEVSQW